jgi:hypothetical protein
MHLYSKLQILVNKQMVEWHNSLIKFEEYKNVLLFLYKMKDDFDVLKEFVLSYTSSQTTPRDKSNEVTLDFVCNNEIIFTFEKSEFLIDYLEDFFPNDKESDNIDEINEAQPTKDDIIDYDFIIINGPDNLKKIIKHIDLIKNDFENETTSIFETESFLYKPLLCEFSNKNDQNDDHDDRPIKIDFCDNNKFYDFLVVGNCFDKVFLTYFMKKYYNIDVKENYVLKIIDNNVDTFIIESSDIVKIDENNLVAHYKKINNIYS